MNHKLKFNVGDRVFEKNQPDPLWMIKSIDEKDELYELQHINGEIRILYFCHEYLWCRAKDISEHKSSEPKFKIGDRIIKLDNLAPSIHKVIDFQKNKYYLLRNNCEKDDHIFEVDRHVVEREYGIWGLSSEEIEPEEKEGMKYDDDKSRYGLLPPEALEEFVKVLTHGAKKYAPNNWKKVQDLDERYFDAAQRHLWAYKKGEQNDPESGYHHLAHALCCISYVLENQLNPNVNNDETK